MPAITVWIPQRGPARHAAWSFGNDDSPCGEHGLKSVGEHRRDVRDEGVGRVKQDETIHPPFTAVGGEGRFP